MCLFYLYLRNHYCPFGRRKEYRCLVRGCHLSFNDDKSPHLPCVCVRASVGRECHGLTVLLLTTFILGKFYRGAWCRLYLGYGRSQLLRFRRAHVWKVGFRLQAHSSRNKRAPSGDAVNQSRPLPLTSVEGLGNVRLNPFQPRLPQTVDANK